MGLRHAQVSEKLFRRLVLITWILFYLSHLYNLHTQAYTFLFNHSFPSSTAKCVVLCSLKDSIPTILNSTPTPPSHQPPVKLNQHPFPHLTACQASISLGPCSLTHSPTHTIHTNQSQITRYHNDTQNPYPITFIRSPCLKYLTHTA